MLAGLSGFLVSEAFLERQLAGQPIDAAGHQWRHLAEWREACAYLGPSSSLRTVFEAAAEPFVQRLGFRSTREIRLLDQAVAATLDSGTTVTGLIVARWGDRLDPLWRLAVTESRKRSASWCLLFNGTHVRLVDAERPYGRRYLQFDLDVSLDDTRATAALMWVLNADMFSARQGAPCALRELVGGSERHTIGVCQSLRDGVLEASREVLAALVSRPPVPDSLAAFEQALNVVYRVVFLLFAEGRALVPVWHPVYRDSYSIEALCGSAVGSVESTPGLWDALRAVSRLAQGGCHAGDFRMTPFNGRLFAPAGTPLANRRELDDRPLARALLALSTRPAVDSSGLERIAYRDLGVEQLGAVYEKVLEYRPRIQLTWGAAPHPGSVARGDPSTPRRSARNSRFQPYTGPTRGTARRLTVTLESGSGKRKATGTFYTPQPLAEYLVRRTLGPLVRDVPPERILQLKVVDPAMGSGAFLVAACGYLAHAYEAALVATGGCHPSDLGPREHLSIRRTIAERCLFGVDLNPMAVQLARLSLWLATLSGDRPLSFLDHRLRAGDSVIGTWLSRLRQAPTPGRRRVVNSLPLFDETAVTDTLRSSLPMRFALAEAPSDTLEQVRHKERTLARLEHREASLSKWKRIADLWCAGWFVEQPASAFHPMADHILTGQSSLPQEAVEPYLRAVESIATSRRFFHWELEFPEAFFGPNGTRRIASGFDAVVGNPPWKMVRAGSEATSLLRFSRDSGVYESQSDGQANLYQLFVERAVALARSGGRLGLVLPSGFASDHGSAPLRRHVFSRTSVDALVGLDNRHGIFPIHRSVRFLLVTATIGGVTSEFQCRLGQRDLGTLESEAGAEAVGVRLTPALLARVSGDSLSVPDVRATIDLAILERAASLFPPLGGEAGWGARFGRELNATDDRPRLRTSGHGLQVIEGKHLAPFRVNLDATRWRIGASDARQLLASRPDRPRLAYRDVASATNRQTLIAAVLPAGCASTHTVFCLRTSLALKAQHFLCGLFNSFVLNYLVRARVSTHVTTAIVGRLPVPTAEQAGPAFEEIAGLSRSLSQAPQLEARARINARVARLYQLSREEFEHVLNSFPLVPRAERDQALQRFAQWTDGN